MALVLMVEETSKVIKIYFTIGKKYSINSIETKFCMNANIWLFNIVFGS